MLKNTPKADCYDIVLDEDDEFLNDMAMNTLDKYDEEAQEELVNEFKDWVEDIVDNSNTNRTLAQNGIKIVYVVKRWEAA